MTFSDHITRAHKGAQERFLASPADVAIYGGAAGAGKSAALLLECVRHVKNPRFGAVIFRRTYPQIFNEGALWDTSHKIYPLIKGRPRESDAEWVFPSGAKIKFGHLEHETSKKAWDGSQIPLICVAAGTEILMGDGSRKAIERICVGDIVATLEGPKPVTRTFSPRVAECVELKVGHRSQVNPTDHAVLTPSGWLSAEDVVCIRAASVVASKLSRTSRKSPLPSCEKFQFASQTLDNLHLDRRQQGEQSLSCLDRQENAGCGEALIDAESDCAVFDDELQDRRQPERLSFRLMLHEPVLRSIQRNHSHDHLSLRAGECVRRARQSLSCCPHYSCDSHRCDGPTRCFPDSDLSEPQQQGDAAIPCHPCWHGDESASVPLHSPPHPFEYDHPYTLERRLATEAVREDSCEVIPVGKRLVYDICVAEVNHYITAAGIINKNCFDELTSFSEQTFWYMFSRNRTTAGMRPYIRATRNPDAESWVAELIAWWIDQDTGFPIPERSGVLRWFVRENGAIAWFDSKESAAQHLISAGMAPDAAAKVPKSLTFIPARLEDNPTLESRDPGYRANLMALEHVERERLLGGNWKIRPAAGLKFPRDKWVIKYKAAPPGMRLLRFWDKAYTEGGKGARTSGTLMGALSVQDARRLGLPQYWIINVEAGRWGDAEREATIRTTAEMDKQKYGYVTTGLEEEGGAGKHSANMTVWNLSGFDAYSERPRAKKHIRWSELATQQQVGNVAIVTSDDWDWTGFIRELDALAGDEKLDKGKLRDCADSASGAFKGLTDRAAQLTGDLMASGGPEDDHSPLTDEELADESTPDWVRELVADSRAARDDER